MGGIGKTTLAAMVVRSAETQRNFDRIGFATIGMAPELIIILRMLYLQLVGTPMKVSETDTVGKLLSALQEGVEKKRVLVVLDDVWEADHFRSALAFLRRHRVAIYIGTKFRL